MNVQGRMILAHVDTPFNADEIPRHAGLVLLLPVAIIPAPVAMSVEQRALHNAIAAERIRKHHRVRFRWSRVIVDLSLPEVTMECIVFFVLCFFLVLFLSMACVMSSKATEFDLRELF